MEIKKQVKNKQLPVKLLPVVFLTEKEMAHIVGRGVSVNNTNC